MLATEFFDLQELGLPNSAGFRIERFQKKIGTVWHSYRPDVLNGNLLAKNLAYPYNIAWEGGALVGMRFVLRNAENVTFYLIVADVGSVPMWARNPAMGPVAPPAMAQTYLLGWKYPTEPDKVLHKICGAPSDNDGLDPFYAVLFDDDRIDAEDIRVTGQSRDWFNIGCAGHALAKQHLTGHTRAAAAILQLPIPSVDQRTANLKMIAGDYCGNGNPFTVAGQPLWWRDESGWFDSTKTQPGGVLEARWTQKGAICLNTPRVDWDSTTIEPAFPNGVEPLLAPNATPEIWCPQNEYPRPPPCGTQSWEDMGGAHVVSVNLPLI